MKIAHFNHKTTEQHKQLVL